VTKTTFKASEVCQTIAQQVGFLKRRGLIRYKTLLQVDDRTLRLHHKTGSYVYNTDVHYDRGRDLYDVTVYKLDMRLKVGGEFNENFGMAVGEKTYEGMFVEDLAQVIGKC
jgi:hypothetical protein